MSIGYDFPRIENIREVLPHIDHNFRVTEGEGLTFINYNVMSPETFPTVTDYGSAVRRECRGIAFNSKTGDIVSRPFHKFFNNGERDDIVIPSLAGAVTMEKLDGSMIRPLWYPAGLRWGTKAGITDVGMLAETYIADKPEYQELAEEARLSDWTPILEYCAPDNRIILEYPTPSLVLLSIRYNTTGRYFNYQNSKKIADYYGVPMVGFSTVEDIKNAEGIEGIVTQLYNGHMFKEKAEWYVKVHKAKDLIGNRRKLVKLFLDNGIDDVYPTLLPDDKDNVKKVEAEFWKSISDFAIDLSESYRNVRVAFDTKKDFALADTGLSPEEKTMIFRIWDGKAETPWIAVVDYLSRNLSSQKKYEEVMKVIGG